VTSDETPDGVGADGTAARDDPFGGLEVAVLVDQQVYAAGQPVRVTVSATNGDRSLEQQYPGWLRFELTIRDDGHHPVAEVVADGDPGVGFTDRWLPGQMLLTPLYWSQHRGPVVPAWTAAPAGPRVPPGRYRVRVSWLGRPSGTWARLPDVHSRWFELV
jgi:hypothetical protein